MTFEQYQQIDAVNWSSLRDLRTSPLLYRYRQQHPRRDTTALIMGRAAHTAILRPDEFPLEFVVYRESKSRGEGSRKRWQAFQEAHAGDTILDAADYDRCLAMRDAVRQHDVAGRYIECLQETEVTIEWQHPSGFKCKARLDGVTQSSIVEIKTSRNPGPWAFGRDCATYGYHGQLAFYRGGLEAARDTRKRCCIIAVESSLPHDVVVYQVPGEVLGAGRELCEELVEKLRMCRDTDCWPGRAEGELLLELQQWAMGEEQDETGLGLDFGGA